ncbi:lipoate--protein ligase [Lactobacillus sp. CC-MHH1034]|uniref:lipoate--protein ligase n=1 Tax=Agrilactobacillus fermenti TaxID=2586909 RepID=UPI001E2C4E7E|nr:lipoate--protein ligase [Agrilactobacillus fermenti]MCD2257052.1 lipoate--protein ligase [Agrilactobacillus fermenti]
MIYIPVISKDVYFNFALEYYLLTQKRFEQPVFMLWSTTPTVMLGKYQDAVSELNFNYIQDHKINVVRRYSGGGTIYTDTGGCQFTFIQPDIASQMTFDTYLKTVAAALQQIQIPAQRNSRNDLVVNHRKFSGSAQYRHDGYTLHHGSLLFDTDQMQMLQALNVDHLKLQSKHIASVKQRTINLKTLRPDLTNETFMAELTKQILACFNHVDTYELTAEDQQLIVALAKHTFADSDFIYGKTPKSQFVKKAYLPGGGLVQFNIDLDHGQITNLHLSGDFFGDIDTAALNTKLQGTKYIPAEVMPKLAEFLQQTPILGITAEDLTRVIFA